MRALGLAVTGFVVGGLVAWIGTTALLMTLGRLLGVSMREGAWDMGAAFVWGPMAGILGAVAGIWLGLRRARKPRG
jgi:hypothetical protein